MQDPTSLIRNRTWNSLTRYIPIHPWVLMPKQEPKIGQDQHISTNFLIIKHLQFWTDSSGPLRFWKQAQSLVLKMHRKKISLFVWIFAASNSFDFQVGLGCSCRRLLQNRRGQKLSVLSYSHESSGLLSKNTPFKFDQLKKELTQGNATIGNKVLFEYKS